MGWRSRTSDKARAEKQLDAELRFHVEQQIADYIAEGMTPEEARRRARMEFGGLDQVKEEVHEVRRGRFLETLVQDVRYGLRMLRKTPMVTAAALLSLALGIGANTAIFSLIDAVMLRMLPVNDPAQLVQIKFLSPESDEPRGTVTNPIWEQVRDHQDVFSGVFAWFPTTFDLAYGGEQKDIHGVYASGAYFSTLGVRPAAGRLLVPSDDARGCSGVAVLGYGFWQQHYGGAESAVGSVIRLDGHSFPIIGVAQRGFNGTDVGRPLDVAIPICADGALRGKNSFLDGRSTWWLMMIGRLKPSTIVAEADARMKVLSPRLFNAVVPQKWDAKSQDIFRKYTFVTTGAATGTGGFFGVREQYRQPLKILMVVVGLVLLIACANIASLLTARSAARQKEMAVRLSLGASRGRLIRQVLTESLVLSGCGALLGILFSRWGSVFLVRMVSPANDTMFLELQLNTKVLAFTIAVAVLCGLLFGVLPAFLGTRVSTISAMKEGDVQGAGGRSHSSATRWIVGVQIALSLILLVGTGLFIHTFTNLMTIDAGFDRTNVLLVETNVHNAQVPEAARTTVYGQMLAKLQSLPGVISASQTWMRPLSGMEWNEDVRVTGYQPPAGVEPLVYLNWVTPDFFSTMRTTLLAGRSFDTRDSATSTRVAVINQLLASTYFAGQNPLGKHLLFDDKEMLGPQALEIIGVVKNAKYDSLSQQFLPTAYVPLAQVGDVAEDSTFEIRTAMNPTAVIPAVREAMSGVNPLASLQFVTLKQEADDSVIQERLLAVLSGFFGALALLLTAIGLYGVMAYVVTLRRHEIGIRMALGAQQGSILRLVMHDAVIVLGAGIAAGLLGSVWITRLVQQLLFGIRPTDPWALTLAVVTLVCIAFVASYVPSRRAMRVDPMVALRHE